MKDVLIECWICGKDHSLFWTLLPKDKRKLCMNCNKVESRRKSLGDYKIVHITKTVVVPKEFHCLIKSKTKVEELDIPSKDSPALAKLIAKRQQLEMIPLLTNESPRD